MSAYNIVLVHPMIPQNTGSIARLCACTGAVLHLIHPLGFQTDEASVRRAGLDYWEHVAIREHANFEAFLEIEKPESMHFFSRFAKRSYVEIPSTLNPYYVFGSETDGLPKAIWERYENSFYLIPIRTHLVRSLNLSQAAAIVLYDGLRKSEGLDKISFPERS